MLVVMGNQLAMEESRKVSNELDHQEKFARDQAFKGSHGMSNREGWLWNIAWETARKYYQKEIDSLIGEISVICGGPGKAPKGVTRNEYWLSRITQTIIDAESNHE